MSSEPLRGRGEKNTLEKGKLQRQYIFIIIYLQFDCIKLLSKTLYYQIKVEIPRL